MNLHTQEKIIKNIDLKFNVFENFYFLGLDFLDNNLSGIKIYSNIREEELFYDYLLDNFNIDLNFRSKFKIYDLLFVRRFDNLGKLEGVKIEFRTNNLNEILEIFNFSFKDVEKFYVERIALDFNLLGDLLKVNVYYKPKFIDDID